MQEITSFRLVSIGGTPITVGGVLTALLMIAAAILVARLIRSALERVRDRAGLSVSSVYIVEKLVGYAVVLAGIFAALTTLGLNLTSFAVFAGAIGVGVGL
ncbi:MAG: transporter, partial [Proteobacteria bacterium]|nr:transporter [Pseudomonadota bacterium]